MLKPSRAELWAFGGHFCHFDPLSAGLTSLGFGAVTAGDVSAGLGVIGAGASAIGAIGQGEASAEAARYQAQVERNNAIVANQNAQYASQAGEVRAANEGLRARQRQAAVTASLAAGGVDVNSGSAEDVRRSQTVTGQEDVETTRANAALQVYGYRTQGTNFTAQAQLQDMQAEHDAEAGWISGLGGLLTSSSRIGFLSGGGNGLRFADPRNLTPGT